MRTANGFDQAMLKLLVFPTIIDEPTTKATVLLNKCFELPTTSANPVSVNTVLKAITISKTLEYIALLITHPQTVKNDSHFPVYIRNYILTTDLLNHENLQG